MRVTRNEKVSSATYYEIDAALHARGSKEPFLKWTCMRTLAILRVHIHDLVERNLGSEVYKKHFKGTPFAARGGFSGTTARLDAWFKTCGICASLALLRPKVIADILTLLEAPTNANDRLQDWYNESAPSGRVNARPEPRTPEESPEASDEEGETAVADINLQILHKTGDPLISFSVEPCATGSAVKEALGQYLGQGEEIETLLCENGKVFDGGQLASSLSLNSSGVCVLRVVLRGIVLPAARTSDDAENDSAEAAKVEADRARDQQLAREASDREAAEAAERQAARIAERERLAKVAADREAAEIAEQEASDGEAAEREAAEASERARLAQEAAEQKPLRLQSEKQLKIQSAQYLLRKLQSKKPLRPQSERPLQLQSPRDLHRKLPIVEPLRLRSKRPLQLQSARDWHRRQQNKRLLSEKLLKLQSMRD